MSTSRLVRLVVGALLLVIAAPGIDGTVRPAPARAAIPAALGPCVGGWQEMPVPDSVFISSPFETLTRNGKPAWILGGTNRGVLALKWTGSRWKRVSTGTRGHRGIVGATRYRKGAVLGVGYYRANRGEGSGSLEPIGGRLISGDWKPRNLPDPPGSRATLTDVVSLPGGRALAVGTRLENGRLRAYSARWTGSSWVRREPASGSGAGLLAADRTSTGAVWAVGWKEASRGKPRPLIAKRTGKGWRTSRGAKLPGGSAVLVDVDFAPGAGGWAVGYLVRKGNERHEVILQRKTSSGWTLVPLPWATDFAALPRSISVAGPGELWISGTQMVTNGREARGFIAHLVDDTWQISFLDVPSDVRSEVMSVAATSWGAIAAANVGASLLVLRTCENGLAGGAAEARDGRRQRISVGNMRLRRESQYVDLDDHSGHEGETATALGPAAIDPAARRLKPPVRPPGFVVRDMTSSAGLASTTKTYDGFSHDMDGDGRRDIFYSRHGGTLPRLAMNGGSRFSNAPGGAFSPVDRHGCDAGDVDGDGNKDILCAVGSSRGTAIQRHELSLAPHTSQRQLVRGGLGIVDPMGRGRHVAFIRLDRDAYPEVFIANAPDRNDGMPGYNRFYRNKAGRLVPAPGVGLDSSHGAECVVSGDFDKDGDQDLVYCTQYGFKGRPAGLRFMRNEGGKLRDRTRGLGISPMGDIDVTFADVTGDGRRDLIQLSKRQLRVSRWTRSGYRRLYQVSLSDAWAVAAGDASGDGRADIYVVRGNDRKNLPDRLLVSRKSGRRFVSVRIPQTRSGSADDVIALDYDRNGRTDFVVLNGRKSAGPIQLLASFPG